MFWKWRQPSRSRLAELEEENERLAREVTHLREAVAALRAQAASRDNLLCFWNTARRENEAWLEAELDRIARGPVGLG